jgi:hypothetical protein
MLWPAYTSGSVETAEWHDINDVSSLDVYWHARHLPCSGRTYFDDFPASQLSSLTPAECHRPFNYGYQVDKQIAYSRLGKKWEPVFTFVENGSPYADDQWAGGHVHMISPDQMAASIWNSLIHGARGVNYFNHSLSGECSSSNNFRHPIYYAPSSCYTEMRAKAKEVNAQITELAPVLNTQSLQWIFNPALDTMLKNHDGSFYIFAMLTGVRGAKGALGMQKLQLPKGLIGGIAEVLFEQRSIPVTASREITDDFPSEDTYRIYRIKAK